AAIPVRASERRDDERAATGYDVRAVELRGDLDTEIDLAHRVLDDLGVGRRGDEVAAHRHEEPNLAVAHRANRLDDVEAVLTRRRKGKLAVEGVEKRRGGLFVDAHRAIALHV